MYTPSYRRDYTSLFAQHVLNISICHHTTPWRCITMSPKRTTAEPFYKSSSNEAETINGGTDSSTASSGYLFFKKMAPPHTPILTVNIKRSSRYITHAITSASPAEYSTSSPETRHGKERSISSYEERKSQTHRQAGRQAGGHSDRHTHKCTHTHVRRRIPTRKQVNDV